MSLQNQQLLAIWEQGRNQHPIDQALTILLHVSNGEGREELAKLPIGERDLRLLSLRESLFGNRLLCRFACEQCEEQMEIEFTAEDLRPLAFTEQAENFCLQQDDYVLQMRPPDSTDLASIVALEDPKAARLMLLDRCVDSVKHQGRSCATDGLPEEIVEATEQQMAAADPFAEVLLNVNCDDCGSDGQVLFDIGQYLWDEISDQASGLLQAVHYLAQAYGWSEQQVLQLSERRRQFYLQQVLA